MTREIRHNWEEVDRKVWCCRICGMYRCVGPGRGERPQRGYRRLTSIEYSTPDGEVIALDPERVPECER